MNETALKRAAAILAEADCLLITSGAGMSVDSGLPAYRSSEGFWKDYPPYRSLRADFAAMTRPRGFETDPAFAWAFTPTAFSSAAKLHPMKATQSYGN